MTHNGYAVTYATIVFVENAFGVTADGGVDAVICGNEVVGGFKHGSAFLFVRRISEAIGLSADVYVFGAAAIAFVELAFFKSAFDVFHGFSLLFARMVIGVSFAHRERKIFALSAIILTSAARLI